MTRRFALSALLCALIFCAAAIAADAPVRIDVDATGSPQQIWRSRMHFPAPPGKLTLLYPKWIPGEHSPSGPIGNVVGLKVLAGGKEIEWRRDPENMFGFHIDVPQGADGVDVAMEFFAVSEDGKSATDRLMCLNWNQVVLYPAGAKAKDIQYQATLKLPAGWKFGTALPVADGAGELVKFKPVSLETLVDSPLIAGEHFKTIDLAPGQNPPHYLHLVGDTASSVEMKPEDQAKMSRLVAETYALFSARHYRSYHFLLTLSEHVDHGGLEHHESSDNRLGEDTLSNEESFKLGMDVLPHEIAHSWNGKYRRPADIATPDYQQPMKTELLWVYEGLTTYLGDVLTARSGIVTDAWSRESFAFDAASLDNTRGRDWRPLADTAVAAQLLYTSGRTGRSRRRGVDFYPEGKLIWLEADVVIRQKTGGKKSLDDFCKLFFGGESGEPKVVPYTFDDLVSALNTVTENDWKGFFRARVTAVNHHAPMGGIEGSGWKLAFVDQRSDVQKAVESTHEFTDAMFSLGFSIGKEGKVGDIIPDSPADRGGLASGATVIAVNGRKRTADVFRAAIKSAKADGKPIELLIENLDYYRAIKIDYRDGEKYPTLQREESKPDLLAEILKPRTAPPTTTTAPAAKK